MFGNVYTRISGLWIGLAVTLCLQATVYVFIIMRSNWDGLVDQVGWVHSIAIMSHERHGVSSH